MKLLLSHQKLAGPIKTRRCFTAPVEITSEWMFQKTENTYCGESL